MTNSVLITRRFCSNLTSFFIIFQLSVPKNRTNAANPAFFELDCKLPKLRTYSSSLFFCGFYGAPRLANIFANNYAQ